MNNLFDSNEISSVTQSTFNLDQQDMQIIQTQYIDKACRTLDIDLIINPKNLGYEHIDPIFKIFKEVVNHEDINMQNEMVDAKNLLFFNILKNESEKQRLPRLPIYSFNLHLKYQCKFCNGAGLNPIMEVGIIPKIDKCPNCLATGIQHKLCPHCHGVGWVGYDVCPMCKGTQRIPVRKNTSKVCNRCHGDKYLDRKVTTGKVLSYHKCTVCKGIGWISPK